MKKKFLFGLIGIVLIVAFIVFTLVVKKYGFKQFDFDITVKIQNHVPKKYDTILSIFSLIGSFEVVSFLLAVLLIFNRKIRGIFIVGLYVLSHFVEIIGKALFNHPGPPFLFFRYDLGFFFPSSYVQTGSSYPSGHSFRTVFFSMLLLFLIIRAKKINPLMKVFFTVALSGFVYVMLISRISLGEHWATDVIGGAILGLGFAAVSFVFL